MLLSQLDTSLFLSLRGTGQESLPLLYTAFFLAKWVLYFVPVYLLSVFLVKATPARRRVAVAAILAIVIGIVVSFLIGHIYHRPRPFLSDLGASLMHHRDSASFPSNHATIMAAFAMTLVLARWWKTAAIAIVATIAVGWSRVFIGVHYPFDILGGFVLGSLSALMSARILSSFGLYIGKQTR